MTSFTRFTFLKLLMWVMMRSSSAAINERSHSSLWWVCLEKSIKLGITCMVLEISNCSKVSCFKLSETEVTQSEWLMLKLTAVL